MTTIAWVWLVVFALLAGLSLRRPVWAVALYFLTYFAPPGYSWWFEDLPSFRWNLIAGVVLAIAVAIDLFRADAQGLRTLLGILRHGSKRPLVRWCLLLLGAMMANAVAVHWLLAPDPITSLPQVVYMTKHVGLAMLIFAAVRRPGDSRIAVGSLAAGAAWLGLAVFVFEQGTMIEGRLERFGPARAHESNGLPALFFVLLPLCWVLLVRGRALERLLAAGSLPLSVGVVMLAKSRGATLAAVVAGVAMLVMLPREFKRAWFGFCFVTVVVASIWAVAMPRAPTVAESTVVERFWEIPEELSIPTSSSSSRLIFWRAGFRVLREHPLGSGGESFLSVRGSEHLVAQGIYERRSVHSGYLQEAIDWGIQGLVFRLAFLGILFALLREIAFAEASGVSSYARAEACGLAAGLIVLLAVSVFDTLLAIEWQYWIAGLALSRAGWPLEQDLSD